MVPLGRRRVYLSRFGFVRLAKPSQQKSSTATAESVSSRYPISVITMVSPPDRSHRIEHGVCRERAATFRVPDHKERFFVPRTAARGAGRAAHALYDFT